MKSNFAFSLIKNSIILAAIFAPQTCYGQSQMQMNEVAANELKTCDRGLNAVYNNLVKANSSNRAFVSNLRISEQAWITFRDAHLKSLYPATDTDVQYGSAFPMCYAREQAKLTRERTKQLQQLQRATAKKSAGSRQQLDDAERKLNITYERALKRYDAPRIRFLKLAQTKWLLFRNSEALATSCLLKTSRKQVVEYSTKTNLDFQRIAQLNEWVEGITEGDVCVGSRPVK